MAIKPKFSSPPRESELAPAPLSASRPELLVKGSDHEFRELVHDMLAFASSLQEVRNKLGQAIGLSGTQYTILMAIARLSQTAPDLGINLLAENLHWSGAFVTIEVNKLVAAGLIEKRANPDDGRRVVLSITPAARKKLTDLKPLQVPANDTLFGSLSSQDFKALRRIMASLAASGENTLRLIRSLRE